MSLHSFSQFDLTTLTLCNSIFDCSDDPTAIKFMRMAPEIFPQFIHSNNNNIGINNHNSNHSIPHQSDTDTTQSNETVIYSHDDIKAAQQLLNMHSFVTINSNTMHHNEQQMDHKSMKITQCLTNNKRKNDRRKHPRKFKTINNKNNNNNNNNNTNPTDDVNLEMISMDLQCTDDHFCLYSQSIHNLDTKLRTKQIKLNEIQVSHNLFPYKCRHIGCNTLFESKSLLKKHEAMHKILICNLCHREYKRKNMFFQHIKNEHNLYICVNCSNMYDTEIQLNKHQCSSKKEKNKILRNHHREKPFKCDICDKAYSSKGHLQKHRMVHDGQRRFYCKYCNKGYIQKWRCKKHQAQCTQCL